MEGVDGAQHHLSVTTPSAGKAVRLRPGPWSEGARARRRCWSAMVSWPIGSSPQPRWVRVRSWSSMASRRLRKRTGADGDEDGPLCFQQQLGTNFLILDRALRAAFGTIAANQTGP